MSSLRVVQKHNAFPSKSSLERSQSTCCNSPDSSFKALWLSPDLKSSNPPSFLHRNKKNPADEFFIFSINPNKCQQGCKRLYILKFLFCFWSGALPAPPVFPHDRTRRTHVSHAKKLFNRSHRPGQETHLWWTTDHSARWEYTFRVDQQHRPAIYI